MKLPLQWSAASVTAILAIQGLPKASSTTGSTRASAYCRRLPEPILGPSIRTAREQQLRHRRGRARHFDRQRRAAVRIAFGIGIRARQDPAHCFYVTRSGRRLQDSLAEIGAFARAG
jgi:hypothetical protein